MLADATRWQDWAGSMITVSEWEREGDPAPGGVGAVRKLGRPPAFAREQILEYDPPHHLAYTIVAGIPVRGYHADIDLVPDARRRHDHPLGRRVRAQDPRHRRAVRRRARTHRARLRDVGRRRSRTPRPRG